MKITMVLGSVSRQAGGLYHSVRRLSQTLAEAGAQIRVLSLRDADTAADIGAWGPLRPEVFAPSGPVALGYSAGLAAALAADRPDVLHQHGIWQATSLAVSRWRRAGHGPVMISPRGMLDPWARANNGAKKKLAYWGYERANLRGATVMHALAVSEAGSIAGFLPGCDVATVPNAMDLGPEPLAWNTRATAPRELLFIGRLHPKKGLAGLIDEWAALPPEQGAGWRLIIAGWDENGHLAELKAQVARLGCDASVSFPGTLMAQAKAAALARASAYVLPSFSEGLPMAVLEAWAAGLPVFMTPECNLPDGFAAGAAVEISRQPGWLSEALGRQDLQQIGQKGRALVAERYSWPIIAQQHLDVYHWMLGHAAKPEYVNK